MTLAIALNIVFATFVVAAIVGGLAWSIVRDRQAGRDVQLVRVRHTTRAAEQPRVNDQRRAREWATA